MVSFVFKLFIIFGVISPLSNSKYKAFIRLHFLEILVSTCFQTPLQY
jgi:hypothetical protein